MTIASILKLLKSMKFAIWLLLIIAAASLISMFIVEFYPLDTSFERWEAVYGEKYGSFLPVMQALHLQDPYRSWWYQLLLGLLTLSLTLCVIDRLPINLRQAFKKEAEINPQEISKYANHRVLKTSIDKLPAVFSSLKSYSIRRWEKEQTVFFTADKGKIGYLGPVFTHLGLLLLAIGGFIAIWGVSINGVGYPGDLIESDKFDFQVRIDDFRIEYYPLGVGQWALVDNSSIGRIVKKLPFNRYRVRFFAHGKSVDREIEAGRIANQFDIDADRGNVRDYISDLTIIDGGKEIASKRVEVNKPMRYKGFRFYQSSFDTRFPMVKAELDSAVILLSRASDGKALDTLYVCGGKRVLLPDGSELELSDFLPHFNMGSEGAFSASASMRNPALKVKIYRGGEEISHQWLFLLHDFHGGDEKSAFSFKLLSLINPRAESKFKTILEIKSNRGYEIIWLGIILATIGVCLSFYLIPRHLRGAALPIDQGYELVIGGYSSGERVHFSEEFNRIIDRIKSVLQA